MAKSVLIIQYNRVQLNRLSTLLTFTLLSQLGYASYAMWCSRAVVELQLELKLSLLNSFQHRPVDLPQVKRGMQRCCRAF
jgi:hypothetical protein